MPFKYMLSNLSYLYRTSAPINVYKNYFATNAGKDSLPQFYAAHEAFMQKSKKLDLSNDWFSQNILHWLNVFKKYKLYDKNIKALEIGSWEGLSSYFILNTLPNANLTSVDTWEGSDEHKGLDILSKIEKNFDANLRPFKDRLQKFKGTSFNFFNTQKQREVFDLIYIDGSHHCDDVMIDAIKGFELLKVGGIMIFDDYFWKLYEHAVHNPAGAINAFLKLKAGSYEIVCTSWQIIIEKTSDRYSNE